ncbi:hypothetical protein H8S95_04600 [Pontibacter sp. KCTC 32443]|nr:hypothetical protein [Pontibacter sp. KCTC 32443]
MCAAIPQAKVVAGVERMLCNVVLRIMCCKSKQDFLVNYKMQEKFERPNKNKVPAPKETGTL